MITNTYSVGVVRDAAVAWMVNKDWPADWYAPVVAEIYDGGLNDINGFHIIKAHALEALAKAKTKNGVGDKRFLFAFGAKHYNHH